MYERFLAGALGSTPRSVLLLGPRQVGKSTLLAALRPDLTLNLASPTTFRDYVSRPEQLEHELDAASAATRTVFIDEVQRVPALLDIAQLFLDRRPPRFRFLLGLASFAEHSSRVRRRLVVFLGSRRQQIEGVEVLPLDAFLALLPS